MATGRRDERSLRVETTISKNGRYDGGSDVAVSWRQLGERSFHGGLALLFERLHFRCGREEVHCHVSATAVCRLELLQHEKDLAIVVARLTLWLDVHRAHLTAILPGSEVCAGAVMRVIET